MKPHIRVLFIFFILAISLAVFTKPLIIFLVKRQLQYTFAGSTVSIAGLNLKFWQAGVTDIEIKKDPLYDFKAKAVKLENTKVVLEDALVYINMNEKSISDFPKNIKSSSGGPAFLPRSLKISNLVLDLRAKEFGFKAGFSGIITMATKGREIRGIEGNFEVLKPGGTLAINDEGYLKNLARASGQPVDILLENFKNYHYNTGKLGVSLNKNDLIFEVILDGGAGRRELKLALHDFDIRRKR